MSRPSGSDISADLPRREGLRRLIAARLAELQRYEGPLRAPESAKAEAIHDGRVASRRLRAALTLYPLRPRRRWEALRGEVRDLGRALGALRDLDERDQALADAAAAADEAERVGLEALRAQGAAARGGALAALAAAAARFFGPSADALRTALAELDAGRGRSGGPAMRRRLRRRLRRARRLAPAACSGAPAHVHALRVALKKLRYHGELLQGAVPGLKALLEPLPALQDRLGAVHDGDAMLAFLVAALARAPREEQAGLCLLLARCHEARARLWPAAQTAIRAWHKEAQDLR